VFTKMSSEAQDNQEQSPTMEENPPKIPKFDLTASSDLLSRLGSFLPQLQAANELLAQEPNTDDYLVDADLASEEGNSDAEPEASGVDDSENENDGESDGDEEVDAKTGKPQQQTIQLRLAVGNVDENPGISWLAAQDEEEEEEAPSHGDEDEIEAEPVSQAESTISSLLGKGKEQKTRPKGPLITEME
jgi:hypothetical protein